MITIDIYVPITGKTYDFSVDENIVVETITEEIVELIIQKENYVAYESSDMYLFSKQDNQVLNRKFSLKENGIVTGNKLILI